MGSLPNTSLLLPVSGRRSFLWTLASLGLSTAAAGNAQKQTENVYRFLTPDCEVRMSVESFGSTSSEGFRFRDNVANRQFCLSASGNENQDRLTHFSGSIAIATYQFRSRLHALAPLHRRENMVTIDHDPRMEPRPPFEKVLLSRKASPATFRPLATTATIPPRPARPTSRSRCGAYCVRTLFGRSAVALFDRSLEAYVRLHNPGGCDTR